MTTLIRRFLQLKQPLRDLKCPLLSSFFFTGALVTAFKGAIAMGMRGTMLCCGEFDMVADDDDSPAEFSALRRLRGSSNTKSLDSAAPESPSKPNWSQSPRSMLVESIGARPSRCELEVVSFLPVGPGRLHWSWLVLQCRDQACRTQMEARVVSPYVRHCRGGGVEVRRSAVRLSAKADRRVYRWQ